MFLRLSNLAPKGRGNRTIVLQCAALVAILSWILVFNGCSGASSMGSKTVSPTTPVTSTNAALTVSATLPQATVGSGYSGSLTASGGNAPYTFVVVSGHLPQGVQLTDSTGIISGTPAATGNFDFSISVSDSKGVSQDKSLQITVANATTASSPAPASPAPTSPPSPPPASPGTGSGESSFSNLQNSGGWSQYGQGPPDFVDCSPSPCNGISFSMTQGVQSPSMSGHATEFNVGGSTPYSDALWNNHLIGPLSSQGTFDTNQTQVASLYNFTYDVYFYGDNLDLSEAVEFDINQFFNGMGFIFGHECRIAGGNQWDVFDNQKGQWIPTGVPCHPNSNSWNHVTLKVQRTSDNHMTYQSITLNGTTTTLNWTLGHGSAPNWYGVTINFQMDGNNKQDSYNVYLDNVTLSYK
jgi:putative Ig domain-containing protein